MNTRIRNGIDRKIRQRNFVVNKKYWSIAASIIFISVFFLIKKDQSLVIPNTPVLITEKTSDNSNDVRLRLGNDSVVNLTGADAGLDRLNVKLSEGQLVYLNQAAKIGQGDRNEDHTLIVPNGKQFRVTLSDGTRVWLNAASKLTFPIAFSGHERRVKLTGEAYFEVAHNKNKPFKVVANGTETIVTGTHFNVSAYSSEKAVRITLIEGGVKVRQNGSHISLKPGYEAVAYTLAPALVSHKSNLDQVMAWKNGYFIFDNMDIVTIMNSVSRWYGISVYVKGEINTQKIGGTFPVTAELDDLLNDISKLAKIKFKRHGKEVVIE